MESVRSILHEASMEPAARIVIVHGALDRGMAFRHVVARLHRYDTIVYDRRGYGASLELGPGADIAAHVNDLVELTERLPSVVIGHSLGGLIALLGALAHPELIAALGLYESPFPGMPRNDAPEQSPPETSDDAVKWFYDRMATGTGWDSLPEPARNALLSEGPALVADVDAVRRLTGTFDLAACAVPTLVGHGENSAPHHIRRAGELANRLPNAVEFTIADAAHGAHRTNPAGFAAFVEAAVALAL